MLETRTQPTSHRTRRMETRPRPIAARSAIGNTALETVPAHPLPRPARSPRTSRLNRSEIRLMGLATTCTAIVCGLLLLYLAAYAHVSQLGYHQAEARTQLRQYQLRNENLRAQRDRLQSRHYVIQEAIALGMAPRGKTPIKYISAPVPRRASEKQAVRRDAGAMEDAVKIGQGTNVQAALDGKQELNGDTTAGSDKQPSFNH